MRNEMRIIKSSIMTGICEIALGLIMSHLGWHNWYYERFKFFGILGIGMIFYGLWHWLFYRIDRYNLWQRFKRKVRLLWSAWKRR